MTQRDPRILALEAQIKALGHRLPTYGLLKRWGLVDRTNLSPAYLELMAAYVPLALAEIEAKLHEPIRPEEPDASGRA